MVAVRTDPETLAAAGRLFRAGADDLAEELAAVDLGATAWLLARGAAPMVAMPVLRLLPTATAGEVDPDRTIVERARCCTEGQHLIADVAVHAAIEQRRLRALGAALVHAALLWAEVETAVSAGLRALDVFAHAHPEVIEGVAAGARPLLPSIVRGAAGVGWLTEDREDYLSITGAPARAAPAPRTLGDLVAGDAEVAEGLGRVRVTEVVRGDGTSAWVVQISGTQEWGPESGPEVFDLTTDVRAVTGDATLAAVGVHLALLQAQRSSGRDTSREPVLLTGHSLGGILAATVAADPAFRDGRRIVGVVTAGSPIDGIAVPSSISVLSLEHTGDAVPRLDGRSRPPGAGRTTVIVDPGPDATGGLASRAHDGQLYAQTARGLDESAARGRDGAAHSAGEEVIAPVLDGGVRAVVHDFTLTREWQNPRS